VKLRVILATQVPSTAAAPAVPWVSVRKDAAASTGTTRRAAGRRKL
jgi:hypothetical protein